MSEINLKQPTHRRGFIGMLAGGAAALGLTALASPFKVKAQEGAGKKPVSTGVAKSEADLWFNKVKGSHRVVYDATEPHDIFPFAWPKVFLMTNEATGTPASDCGVVVVLRHAAIPYAMQDKMWAKYGFGDLFKANDVGGAFTAADAATATKTRNPFLNTKPGDFSVPGIGPVPIGIRELQADGVMFCVCNAAITVYSAIAASKMNMKPEEVMNEWKANIIPGIQVVPSGVWALGRAQEHKCAYIFAG
jgi:intracellular sulfur oxidation DsrE/DsrF family protein